MPTSAGKKTPEEEDEELIREIEQELKEVLDLIAGNKNRTQSQAEVQQLRGKFQENERDMRPVYHIDGGRNVATTMRTKTGLDLAKALKTRIRLGKHAMELEESLHRLTSRYVQVLERRLGRMGS